MPRPESPLARVKQALKRLKEMEGKRQFWTIHWQAVAEYFLTRKASFTSSKQEGAFLDDEIFDSTGPGSLMKAAAAVVGMIWPNGAKSFILDRPRGIRDTDEVKRYYETATEILVDEMDNPKAGLQISLDEYQIDQMAFGTSGVSVMPGRRSKLTFKAQNVKFMSIDEGPDGFVDTVYIEYEWPIRQVVKEYGLKSLHEDTQKRYNDGKEDEKIKILFCIQPRMDIDPSKEGVHSMEFESMHIEIQKEHLIKEGGFKDLPIKVARLRKALGEIYGRSPAMEALPDVQEINAIWESITVAVEKKVDPPLAVYDDGFLGSNQIDTSAGAINVMNMTGRAGAGGVSNPIVPLFTVEEIDDAVGLLERLEKQIADRFMLDRLLDFNNEVQMTLGEVNKRDKIRGFLIGSMFARQIAELYSPLVERSFNILFEMGELGVIEGSPEHAKAIANASSIDEILLIPDEIVKKMRDAKGNVAKLPPFKIKYVSPAARILQAEQAQAIIQTLDFIISASQVNPEVADNVDMDEAVKLLSFIWGAPTKILNSEEGIKAIRKGREEALKEQQEMSAAEPMSKAVKNVAEASAIKPNSYGLNGKGKNVPAKVS